MDQKLGVQGGSLLVLRRRRRKEERGEGMAFVQVEGERLGTDYDFIWEKMREERKKKYKRKRIILFSCIFTKILLVC